jgi:branched-chain amino acid transport system ATP-binding protein
MRLLEINDLNKSFGGLAAVNDVSMHIDEGEIVGMIGPNGAGKTTIFNLISGSMAPDSGSIVFGGQEIQGLGDHEVCQKGICRTYQIVKPFNNLTVLENVMIGAFKKTRNMKSARQFALELLQFVGLYDKKDYPGSSLTIADKKCLELTRALATQPKLLLLDEVMAGLNPKEQNQSINLIQKINRRKITLLVIEHKMKIIMSISTRIVALDYGQKIADGSPDEISRDPKVIQAYLGKEAHIAPGR